MSAKRMSLLAAAVCGVLAPATSSWAQTGAYGASAIVEHNDLRWFEPVELDIDGQMPRDDAGFFFSADKLWWGVINPRVTIGQEGLDVQSEQVLQNPDPEVAILAVDQILRLEFIQDIPDADDRLNAAVAFSGLGFRDAVGNPVTLTTFDQLQTDLRNGDAFVAGAPQTYTVRNGIRDALPDAGFAWGERYELGYSDGEQGWMLTILDGPEANAGGTWGAGEFSPYTSQSGDGPEGPGGTDPAFNSDLDDDDGDGILDGDGEFDASDLFALGFGSVAVNFNLPNEDFLRGFRDYNNGDNPFTTTGPVVYVGNTGAEFTDISVIGLDFGVGAIADPLNTNDAAEFTADINAELQTEMFLSQITSDITGVTTSVDAIETRLLALGEIDPANPGNLDAALADVRAEIQDLTTAVNAQPNNGTMLIGDKTPVFTELNALNAQLAALDVLLGAVDTGDAGGAGGTGQQLQADEEQRLADDLNGNGAQGFTLVRADIDGDGVIEADEVVALILDFNDLHEFNVFFDQVTVRNRTEIDGVELMRTHQLSTRHKLQQGRWDDLRLAYGVRFLNVEDDFFFQGLGSVLGRTSVGTEAENQIVGPQLGLQWTRRDGPWNFVVEARGTLGYNIVDVDQYGIFGEELIPGALNRPASGRATTSVDGRRYDEFSPLAELRAQLRYRIADSLSLQAGYTAKYVGNIHRGAQATAWNAPDFGINDSTSDLFTNGLNFGIELRH